MHALKASGWLLLTASIVAFGLGLLLDRIYLCGEPGPWVLIISIALAALAGVAFFAAAWSTRSWRLAFGGVAAAAFAFVLLYVSFMTAVAGCSGV